MFTFKYEEFLSSIFGSVCSKSILFSPESKCMLKLGQERAIRYLEMKCSAVYGYSGQSQHCSNMTSIVSDGIPSAYESGLCLELLRDQPINQAVIETLANVISSSRRPTGLYNYFMNISDPCQNLFPDDIDDTSCFAGVLYNMGRMSLEECQSVAKLMLDNVPLGPNGGLGCWVDTEKMACPRTVIIDSRLLTRVREDIGSIANALWFLAMIGMDTEEKALPSHDCINKFLDEHLRNVNRVQKQFEYYYMDKYVIYFLFARYIEISKYAQNLLGSKFAALVKNALLEMSHENCHVLQMACCILAAMHLQLHNDSQAHLIELSKEEVEQIRTKIKNLCKVMLTHQSPDGSFPLWKLFKWDHTGYYGGSRVESTVFALVAMSRFQKEILGGDEKFSVKDLAVY